MGAPLLGRELERGTWRLAWSQTVPRTRWLVTKLSLVTGGLVVFGAAVTVVMGWLNQRGPGHLQAPAGPLTGGGPTFTASLLCAFGLGVLAGLLLRNTIGAMVAAYVAWEIPATVAILISGPIHIPAPARHADRMPGRVPRSERRLRAAGHRPPGRRRAQRRAQRGGARRHLPTRRPVWTEQLIQGGLFLAIAVITLGAAIGCCTGAPAEGASVVAPDHVLVVIGRRAGPRL